MSIMPDSRPARQLGHMMAAAATLAWLLAMWPLFGHGWSDLDRVAQHVNILGRCGLEGEVVHTTPPAVGLVVQAGLTAIRPARMEGRALITCALDVPCTSNLTRPALHRPPTALCWARYS